ncbi:hypothetical protein RhiirC2_767844 [Rhizophagus irregularis]|uniref:Uncharacterized protein n=1 Tax=Rhizophagus irregularis TaxID=588596 RepID=A0A2N1P3G6_9GLOM|nr:hypothetical protein RhiirC2_767844 [Rhizophagus irregularis]
MNTRVAAEWSILKTNGYETPIDWNITWNLIHRYKGFNCISVKKHWHLIFITKLFAKLLPIELIWLPRCNATVAWKKARNIGRKDKLNRSENMDRYYKSSYQNSKHLRQDKQYLKENNLIDSQEDQIVVLDDIPIEQKSVQSETSLNENPKVL